MGFFDKIFGTKKTTTAPSTDTTGDPPVKSCSTTTAGDVTSDPPVKSCSTSTPPAPASTTKKSGSK